MQHPAVSVVIPAYNAAECIEETLDSVLSQDFDGGLEIVCVDDGSTDATGEILARRAAADARLVVISQENAGRSVARNAGINAARGKYLLFLDSDDLLVSDALATLTRACEDENLDIVYFDASSFISQEEPPGAELQKHLDRYIAYYARKHEYPVCSGKEMLTAMRENKEYLPSACFQMARLSYVRNNSLRFIDGIIHEDNAYTFETMVRAGRVGHVARVLYLRRIHEGSTMTRTPSFANAYGYFRCYLAMQQVLLDNKDLLEACPEAEALVFSVLENARRTYAALQKRGVAKPSLPSSGGEDIRLDSLLPLEASLFDRLVSEPIRDEEKSKETQAELRKAREKLRGIERSKTYRTAVRLRKILHPGK